MGLRDILVIAIIGSGALAALVRPWIGGLTWNWISFMNPHRMTWAVRDWPVAQAVAITTLIGLLLTREKRMPPLRAEMVLMAGLAVYFCVTTAFAWNPGASLVELEKVLKIYLFIFVTVMLFYQPARIRWLLYVTVGSIGFFGVKGGLFTILTAGHYRVWGPAGSFIADNTSLGLALGMILPMAFYGARGEPNRWFRLALYGIFFLSIPAIMFTYSRGAFLGLLAVLFVVLWRYSKAWLLVAILAGAGLFYFSQQLFPEQWLARQETTVNYQEDYSAMQRIQAWGVAINVALDRPLLGAGFDLPGANPQRWLDHAMFLGPWNNKPRAAHSIWFQILGHHGFVALFMFVGLLGATWWRLGRTARLARAPDVLWIGHYARGMQLALVPYAVSGTFLSLAYFDLFYTCVAFSVILDRVLNESLAATEVDSAEERADAEVKPAMAEAHSAWYARPE